MSIIPATVRGSGISCAIAVTDKGFYSAKNAKMLESEHLDYIMPLKCNNSLTSYGSLTGDMKRMDGFFKFDGRIVWHHTVRRGRRKVVLYLDPSLKIEEERDILYYEPFASFLSVYLSIYRKWITTVCVCCIPLADRQGSAPAVYYRRPESASGQRRQRTPLTPPGTLDMNVRYYLPLRTTRRLDERGA